MLDIRTIILGHVLTNCASLLVALLLWWQNRKRFAGLGFWVLGFVCQTVAVALIALRGPVPDWASIVVANTLAIGSIVLGYVGQAHFFGQRARPLHLYLLLAVFAAVHAYFTFAQPSLPARTLNLAGAMLLVFLQCLWFLVYRVPPTARRWAREMGLIYGAYALTSAVRIGVVLAAGLASSDFFQAGAAEAGFLLVYQLLPTLLTFSLALMVNRRLLAEIGAEEARFAQAFRSSPYAIILSRLADGRILDVNDGFTELIGYRYDEAVGRTVLDLGLWVEEQGQAAVIQELAAHGRVRSLECLFQTRSGQSLIGLLSADILETGDEKLILSSIDDITERKRAQEALAVQNAELDAFAHTVAHDIKNPLSTMIGFAELLFHSHGTMSPQNLAQALRDIYQAGIKLDKIVEALMLLSGVRKQEVIPEPLDMGGIVRDALAQLQALIRERSAQIALQDEAEWPVARGYTPWIVQIWVNYLSNAIKYGGEPPVVQLGAQVQADGQARFWVRDNGPGLSAEDQAELFVPFARLAQARTKGHGLGLSIVRRIVEKLGGQVGVESEPGQGSTFYFTLPLAASSS